jgi:hypothetical protein
MLQKRCANDNHGRTVVTVRFCATCGTIVNRSILARGCSDQTHSGRRRARSAYCVDCGDRLAPAAPSTAPAFRPVGR